MSTRTLHDELAAVQQGEQKVTTFISKNETEQTKQRQAMQSLRDLISRALKNLRMMKTVPVVSLALYKATRHQHYLNSTKLVEVEAQERAREHNLTTTRETLQELTSKRESLVKRIEAEEGDKVIRVDFQARQRVEHAG